MRISASDMHAYASTLQLLAVEFVPLFKNVYT
jgi:hypothetical protein